MFKKIMRWTLRIFLGLAVFWTLVHLVEDWRGKRAWESWKQQQEAKGARYEVPTPSSPLPDMENFAKAPVVEATIKGDDRMFGNFKFDNPYPFPPGWKTGHPFELQAWADINKAKDLGTFLAPAGPALNQIAEAAARSDCHFDFQRAGGQDSWMPFMQFRYIGRMLTVRSLLELHTGRTDNALQDIFTQLRIIRHLSGTSPLEPQLVQLAMSGFGMQAIWEGLEAHAWNDAQLEALQRELSRVDELRPLLLMAQGQRLENAAFYTRLVGIPWWERNSPFPDKLGNISGRLLFPRGWIYMNWLNQDEYLAATWLTAADPSHHRVHQDRVHDMEHWWDGRGGSPYTVFAKIFSITGPGMTSQAHRFAERQVSFDEAMIVCALERYRLVHKAYPESLEVLVPAYALYLPTDVFTGAAYRYERTSDGVFRLYSLGWNGTDEHGTIGMNGTDRDMNQGDWPWPHTAAH